ncbi:Na/Pi cotransporter family protein [Ramlibacter sp. AN1133]|uniref:Na/Pi cotransporter family protein n=1 Tax=Ramlibacter sp. AN1133 TaxID=3133429 RepID=UPI0030C21688
MTHLLNLLAAVALLVWGTSIVKAGVLATFGPGLRHFLSTHLGNRCAAAAAGLGVTVLVQSSTATGMIVASFAGQGLVPLPAALAAMLGADLGSSLMAVVFSLKLTWLSPFFIFVGVVLFTWGQDSTAGRAGRTLIGLGLMLLALRLISEATGDLVRAQALRELLGALGGDILLEITVGALLTIAAYSSLAVVLLTAALAGLGVLPVDTALGLVLGANLGSGLLGVLGVARAAPEVRQVPLGNLVFKAGGVLAMAPFVPLFLALAAPRVQHPAALAVGFHVCVNALIAIGFLGLTAPVAALVQRLLRQPAVPGSTERLRHLHPTALTTPSVAISCAAREALHQADVVETMLRGIPRVIEANDLGLSQALRSRDDEVDALYSSIKYYLTRISPEVLDAQERRRWKEIMRFTINLEQVGDIIESILADIEERKIGTGRCFSDAGLAEIHALHARLVENLRLGMSVFLSGSEPDARRLLEEKAAFGELERSYEESHLGRLADNTAASIQTSSLHLDLIRDLRRINSHLCATAYPVLEAAHAPRQEAEPACAASASLPQTC